MEQLVEDLTRGNVSQVKFVLTSVVAALAVYQLVLIAVGYGKLRTPLLGSRAASWTHRASGDAIVVLIVLVGLACLALRDGRCTSRTARDVRRRSSAVARLRLRLGIRCSLAAWPLGGS